ncbi:MAG: wax ester/triacylglycerol synthase family O-acyltransferase [Steroidobacteraceae bacterium]|nr:wax ester/triacylglycerol synthase family O-acyltransferase [Steroidobacteraceae bacterium]MBP7014752.1 wax ester/triacylglycerol synthase family O-acyltransferase [Steroidobacteraceae bacterium]
MSIPIPMLDLMFFLTESQDNPRHVGALLIFQRPLRGGADIVDRIVNAYRRATPVPPFNRIPILRRVGLPEWQEVDRLDADYHFQRRTLPAPGSDAQLDELVAELHAPMLDRRHPGWRVYLIEGLERYRFAVFIKIHHSLVDGESGIALVRRSLSRSPRDRRIRAVIATSLPVATRVPPKGLLPRLERDVTQTARTALSIGWGSERVLEECMAGLRGFSSQATRPFTAPLTPMNEPIRNARAIAHTVLPLRVMTAVARAWGTTLNDVALCVLDAAMNRYLRSIGRPADRALVAICPVSLQDRKHKQLTTQVSVFWAPLGTPSAAIGRRMREVIANTRAAKERIRALPKDVAYAYAVLTFALGETLALVSRGSADFFVPANVLISNVHGPGEPLYLAGARLEALCPVSTLIAGMGLNITFMSYAGQVTIGFTANASALPHAGRLARYTREAFATLQRQTPRTRPGLAQKR